MYKITGIHKKEYDADKLRSVEYNTPSGLYQKVGCDVTFILCDGANGAVGLILNDTENQSGSYLYTNENMGLSFNGKFVHRPDLSITFSG